MRCPQDALIFMKSPANSQLPNGPMCTGKRQTHIRNAPSSRTAVTGIGPYKRISNISQYNAQNRHSPQKAVPVPFTDISPLRTAQRTSIVSRSSVNASLPPPGRPEIVSRISCSVMETDQTVS